MAVSLDESLSPFDNLKRTTGVSDRLLDSEIKERDFHTLGRYFDTLSGLLERLNLIPAEHADINRTADRDGIQAGVAHALRLWHRVDPSRATFRNLVEILVTLRRMDIANQVCKYIVKV